MSQLSADNRPNVLWIMSDQHNAKCTSWGAFPTAVATPGLDRLAQDGVRFDRAQCQNPICTPSRTSYLTGQYPSNHGIYGLTKHGGTVDAPTLIGALRSLGYRTGAFGKIHTPVGLIENDLDRMIASGADPQADNNLDSEYRDYLREQGLLDRAEHAQEKDGHESGLPYEHHSESWLVDQVSEFIADAVADGDPFCGWVSFRRPHQPYVPPTEFWEQYPPERIELPPTAFEDLSDKPPNQSTFRGADNPDDPSPHAEFSPAEQEAFLRRKLRGYLGCVSMVDDCVDRLLDALEGAGIREDTIVIYCADHGDFAAEHGLPEKAPGISYDAITRIPFIWSWPGRFQEDTVVDELVETVDLFPTLLSLIEGEDVPAADGEDLTGLLTGENPEPVREYAITENVWTKTVRTRDQKLTVYPPGFTGAGDDEYLEFYDLATDPWERDNLAVRTDAPTAAINTHLKYLRQFLQTQRRGKSTLHVERETGPLADGTVPPRKIREHLAASEGAYCNYL